MSALRTFPRTNDRAYSNYGCNRSDFHRPGGKVYRKNLQSMEGIRPVERIKESLKVDYPDHLTEKISNVGTSTGT